MLVTVKEVRKASIPLKKSKSVGPNELSAEHLFNANPRIFFLSISAFYSNVCV